MIRITYILLTLICFGSCGEQAKQKELLFKNVDLIVGDGSAPQKNIDILIKNGIIAAIGSDLDKKNKDIIDLTGKTVMPAMICAHMHAGVLKGTTVNAANYTKENLLDQLKKYADFGILNVQTMGTDRPLLFNNGLYDSIKDGKLPGARLLSAGYGFNVPDSNQSPTSHMNLLYRPATVEEIPAQLDSLSKLHIEIVKIWVDDFAGSSKKMEPAIYKAIIAEAHKRNMRVAAHLYYLSDARKLVSSGVDIVAHSIRDSIVDDNFLDSMRIKKVVYIPTLSLDEFSFIYSRKPEWINDPFFKASLEPCVYEMITSEKYRDEVKNSPLLNRNINGLKIAMANLKKIAGAGILVAMGTDSGALPIRAQGFSEHLELELMVQSGMSPLQAITAATSNSAKALQVDDCFGTLEKGKTADLLILTADPITDIKNTRKIEAVYKAGVKTR